MITTKAIMAGTGCGMDTANLWQKPIQDACDKFGLTSKNAIAAFLANIGVETGSLKTFVENLNYSAKGLAATWPNRYSATGKSGGAPNALANSLHRKPEAIANNTYANRMGNGSVASGDGWKYRGRGPIQTTGKDNYIAVGKALGLDLVTNPDLLLEPKNGAMSAAYFFKANGIIELANAGNFNMVVKRINGAAPNAANHGSLRISRYNDALRAL